MTSRRLPNPYDGGNAVLDRLPAQLLRQLYPHLVVFFEEEATVRIFRDDPIETVYFPIDAIYSVIVELSDGRACEVDIIGREAMVCSEVAVGAVIAARTVLSQGSGYVARLTRDRFLATVKESSEFRRMVHEAVRRQWFVSQQTTACNYAHATEQRAARWILMTHDAIGQDTFVLRAQFASMMLGMTEQAVLAPFRSLVEQGCISYEAEQVTMLSRALLRGRACECYQRQNVAPFITTEGLTVGS